MISVRRASKSLNFVARLAFSFSICCLIDSTLIKTSPFFSVYSKLYHNVLNYSIGVSSSFVVITL